LRLAVRRREAKEVMMIFKKAGLALATVLIFASATTTVLAGTGPAKNTLGPGEKLKTMEELKSISGKYTLILQDDGNLVAHDNRGKVLWYSGTMGSGAVECVMQGDGNLLLNDASAKAVWATYTDGHGNAKLVIQDDGNLVIYNERGLAVWAKGRIKDSLSSGENLLANEFLRSQNRIFTLKMQSDGNLVVENNQGKAFWNSHTDGSGAVECLLQSDGNLVLKDSKGSAVWATKTEDYPKASLLMDDDGQVVLYEERGSPFWTNGKIIKKPKPEEPPVPVRRQDDAGSGRDAGNSIEEPVPLYPAAGPFDGELGPGDDVDLYSVRLDRGWRLLLKLMNGSGQDFNLALLKSNGDVLDSSTRGAGQSESLDFAAPATGMYYVRVSRHSGQGHYQMEISIYKLDDRRDILSTYDAKTGDDGFDNALYGLNHVAYADLANFMDALSGKFGLSRSWIENLVNKENVPPADVYMIARTASVTHQPLNVVEKNYMDNRGQGWGVVAKRLGIKPGSQEFHALKNDDMGLLSKGKGHGQDKKDTDKR
jgi:hypothetical protein